MLIHGLWTYFFLYSYIRFLGHISKYWNFLLKFAVSFDVLIRHFRTHTQIVIPWNLHPAQMPANDSFCKIYG